MWWILQIIGCMGVAGGVASLRHFGVGITSWVIYSGIAMGISYFAFSKSYAIIAPNFVLPWFVGQTSLNILGVLVGFVVFKDIVTLQQWIGIALSIIGGYLLIR